MRTPTLKRSRRYVFFCDVPGIDPEKIALFPRAEFQQISTAIQFSEAKN
jgi:hypothetical protein